MAKDKEKIEDVLKQLEAEVAKLESRDISLEDAIEAYKNGVVLSKKCNDIFEELQESVVKKVTDGKIENFNQE